MRRERPGFSYRARHFHETSEPDRGADPQTRGSRVEDGYGSDTDARVRSPKVERSPCDVRVVVQSPPGSSSQSNERASRLLPSPSSAERPRAATRPAPFSCLAAEILPSRRDGPPTLSASVRTPGVQKFIASLKRLPARHHDSSSRGLAPQLQDPHDYDPLAQLAQIDRYSFITETGDPEKPRKIKSLDLLVSCNFRLPRVKDELSESLSP